jgi:hypothetical protein
MSRKSFPREPEDRLGAVRMTRRIAGIVGRMQIDEVAPLLATTDLRSGAGGHEARVAWCREHLGGWSQGAEQQLQVRLGKRYKKLARRGGTSR